MQIFPADPFTDDEVARLIAELESAELVTSFASNGKDYLAITGWHHQRIDKPTYKYPSPPKEFYDRYQNGRGGLAEDSGTEGNGVESIGTEGNGNRSSIERASGDKFSDAETAEVAREAARIGRTVKILDARDRDLILRVSVMLVRHSLPPDAVEQAIESVGLKDPEKPAAWFRTCITNYLKDSGGSFRELERQTPLPEKLRKRQRKSDATHQSE